MLFLQKYLLFLIDLKYVITYIKLLCFFSGQNRNKLLLLQKMDTAMNRMKYLIAFLLLFSASSAVARTLEIKMSQCPKPYVDNLRKLTAGLARTDVLILNFDKSGKYEFDGSLKFKCNTTIKGVNSETTTVIVKEGFSGGKSRMIDDTFFAVHGSSGNTVKVEVRDIKFELVSHKGTLWEKAPKHIVKVCYGNGVVIDNVTFFSRDAVITHVDLRDCSNAVVENCTFENYNNCQEGGCLWSRGNQANIVVRNNTFSKYGKDEVLAFWGGNYHNNSDTRMSNITVDGNKFYYGNKIKSSRSFLMSVFICFYHFTESSVHNKCHVSNIKFCNNTINIDAPTYRDISLNFDTLADVDGVEISNNNIINTAKTSSDSNYMNDIVISAVDNIKNPIIINNNNVKSSGEVLSDGRNNGYTFVSLENADVIVDGNHVDSDYGVRLIWCHSGNVNIDMKNNEAFGLDKTAVFSSNKSKLNINLSADGNKLNGDTRIYCNNVKKMSLTFKNNTFNSSDYHFFLQEAADQASITFENNIVNASTGKGTLFANYSGKSYNFTKLNISNNVFNGIKRNGIDNCFKNVKNKTISGNIYR